MFDGKSYVFRVFDKNKFEIVLITVFRKGRTEIVNAESLDNDDIIMSTAYIF